MFRENLLESSTQKRNGTRWSMALAFAIESAAAAVLVLVPLASTGVIPVGAAHLPPRIVTLQRVQVVHENHDGTQRSGRPAASSQQVVTIADNQSRLFVGPARDRSVDVPAHPDAPSGPAGPAPDLTCTRCGNGNSVIHGPSRGDKPLVISQLSPAQLVYRVEPVYPRPAVVIGLQGEVKLHALIAKDGTIQSLSLISGHPMLAQAALDAVRQWRYRPYVLNGEAVEVETLITVNFRRDR